MTSKPKQSKSPKPLVLRANTIWFDVDDTLVLWNLPRDYKGEIAHIRGHNEYSHVTIDKPLAVNTAMVETLKQHKKEGCCIVVWSWGGAEWAEAVVKALQLEEFVDLIADKPITIYDDWQASVWMPKEAKYVLPDGWSKKMTGVYYTGTKAEIRAQWEKDYPGQKWEDTYDDEDQDE